MSYHTEQNVRQLQLIQVRMCLYGHLMLLPKETFQTSLTHTSFTDKTNHFANNLQNIITLANCALLDDLLSY